MELIRKCENFDKCEGRIWVHTERPHPELCVQCLKGDEVIPGDYSKISDIRENDKVLGISGLQKVSQLHKRRYNDRLVKIRGVGIIPFSLTPEHPIKIVSYKSVYRSGNKYEKIFSEEWRNAEDITPIISRSKSGDYLIIPRYKGMAMPKKMDLMPFARWSQQYASSGFPKNVILNRDSAWLMGIYVAEGCSGNSHAIFSLNKKEITLKNKIKKIAKILGYKTCVEGQKKYPNTMTVHISSRILARALPYWCGKGASNKRIPEFILLNKDLNLLRGFIDGYEKGDFCHVNRNGKEMVVGATVSKILALQLQLAYARLGKFLCIYEHRQYSTMILGRKVNTKTVYSMRYYVTEKSKQIEIIQNDRILVPVRKVKHEQYNGEVFNIGTNDNTYLVSNVVVHNCFYTEHDAEFKQFLSTLSIRAPEKKLKFNRKVKK